MNNPINIALFGFGRIGRNLFPLGYKNPNFNFVSIDSASDFIDRETELALLNAALDDAVAGRTYGDASLSEQRADCVIYGWWYERQSAPFNWP